MKLINIYKNFWLRNLCVICLFIILIFSCVYTDYYEKIVYAKSSYLEILWKIFLGVFPLYLFQIISNVLIIKELFLKKKYKLFAVVLTIYWIITHLFLSWFYKLNEIGEFTLISTLGAVINCSGIYFLHLWILRNISKSQKILINTQLELDMLKGQLNPHFLLNAMNNLYGEALTVPENVAERILNLSKLLRYQVEASAKNLVALSDEFHFLEQYIEYYQFRNKNLEVDFRSSGRMENIYIPPLLLMSLLENAVKFSCETDNPLIRLELIAEVEGFSFLIENNYSLTSVENTGTGIGLSNLMKRLDVYGYENEFRNFKQDNLFIANLKIWGLPTDAL